MTHKSHLAAAVAVAATLAALPQAAPAHGEADHPGRAKTISTEVHAFGVEGDPKEARRTIAISMDDSMRYSKSELRVKQDEVVTFVVTNKGKLLHEFVIGTGDELLKHAELMRQHPGMEHDEPFMAHVKPGATERLTWKFTKAGTFEFGCMVAGHYEAGMTGAIVVAASDADVVNGEVRKIDKDANKITLRHAEMPHLGMPGMTMVFQVQEPTLLDTVKVGDKVRFKAQKIDGAFVVVELQPAP